MEFIDRLTGVKTEKDLAASNVQDNARIDAGEPYAALRRHLGLLEQYLETAPEIPPNIPPLSIRPSDFSLKIREWKRKPTVLIAGRFDAGKTRIANTLLGSNNLPSQYTPTTSIVTFVRHLSDRPTWQQDNVWIMAKDFDPSQWDDRSHSETHKLMAGGFDMLLKFGTRDGEGEAIGAKWALVYMDAPILRSCTLIDLPGYADPMNIQDGSGATGDGEMTSAVCTLADVLIYTSQAKGFLDASDFLQLGMLLRSLSVVEKRRNFFLVATHADPSISDGDLDTIQKKGCIRLYRQFKHSVFKEPYLSEDDLRERFFTFWYEIPQRRRRLELDLQYLLATVFPALIARKVDADFKCMKSRARGDIAEQIKAYEQIEQQIETAREKLPSLCAELPARRERVAQMREKVKCQTETCRQNSTEFVRRHLASRFEPPAIEDFIRINFQHKDEAKRDAIAKLLEDGQCELESFLKSESAKLQPIIDEYLKQYDACLFKVEAAEIGKFVSVPFNAQGAFLGGLAGIGTLGALGLWASAAGNLGGYILVAKAAGVLSALGFGVGSTAAVSFVAALGGPITVAVGIAVLSVLGIWSLFGESWQSRLAKKISKILHDKTLIEKFEHAVDTHWEQTLTAFDAGAKETEQKFDQYLEATEELVGENSRQKIEAKLRVMEELKSFFDEIPWRWPGWSERPTPLVATASTTSEDSGVGSVSQDDVNREIDKWPPFAGLCPSSKEAFETALHHHLTAAANQTRKDGDVRTAAFYFSKAVECQLRTKVFELFRDEIWNLQPRDPLMNQRGEPDSFLNAYVDDKGKGITFGQMVNSMKFIRTLKTYVQKHSPQLLSAVILGKLERLVRLRNKETHETLDPQLAAQARALTESVIEAMN